MTISQTEAKNSGGYIPDDAFDGRDAPQSAAESDGHPIRPLTMAAEETAAAAAADCAALSWMERSSDSCCLMHH